MKHRKIKRIKPYQEKIIDRERVFKLINIFIKTTANKVNGEVCYFCGSNDISTVTCMLVTPPAFKCNKCGRTEGFYQHIVRSLFPVDQLSPPSGVVFALEAKYESGK